MKNNLLIHTNCSYSDDSRLQRKIFWISLLLEVKYEYLRKVLAVNSILSLLSIADILSVSKYIIASWHPYKISIYLNFSYEKSKIS